MSNLMMYPLYELVRLISFGNESASSARKKVEIVHFAWREVGEANIVALVCSNGYVVLRYSVSGRPPAVRQLPWHTDKHIMSLCFDPTATWLLILTQESELYILPALSMMNPTARVNQLWRLDDITSMGILPAPKDPSVVCWWHTLCDHQIAIVGTKYKKLVFVDLRLRKVLTETVVESEVVGLELVQDDDQMSTHVLITVHDGGQFKLLLECRNSSVSWSPLQDQEFTEMGYDQCELPTNNIVVQTETNKHLFVPLRFQQFKRSVQLHPQYAKGRHFIAAHDNKSCQYQILDSEMEQSPLFVYQVPLGAYNLIFSDRVIFCMTRAGGKKLNIISNQKAETSMADQQVFNKDATLQQFDLPGEERLLAVLKRSFPFYWHEKREEEEKAKMTLSHDSSEPITDGDSSSQDGGAEGIRITTHTVLDGCLIVTNTTVYECRPRVSPERLFLDLAIHQSDPSMAENLGIGLGLNINSLFELVAEFKLARREFSQAIKLYQLSKCSHAKRVASFASHGCITEVMTYLKQVLTNQKTDVNTGEKKLLADMALYCFIHQIHESAVGGVATLVSTFRDFLLESFSYNEKTALELLAKHRMYDLLLELAKARGLILEALQLLMNKKSFELEKEQTEMLVNRGFGAHLARVGDGAFLQCISAADMTDLLSIRPQLAVQHIEMLESVLSQLDKDRLLKLAQIFDPSKPLMKGYLVRSQRSRRTTSLNSLSSFSSEMGDARSQDSNAPDISRLIHFFLSILLALNVKRRQSNEDELMLLLPEDFSHQSAQVAEETEPQQKRQLASRPWPIGCGQHHAAVVRNGNVFTWGLSQSGRLGHGDLAPDNMICPATRVESLHMLQIQVLSVACGGEHTVVLTQQGVYSWGSSRFGQVGMGTRNQNYSRPMLVEKLTDVQCVSVDCGQYHTLVVTADGEVYSWGWGVHGQLGHGSPEDCLVPTKIQTFNNNSNNNMATRIATGYCHSVVLTAEGDVFTFGCGLFGQLGHGTGMKSSVPRKVQDLPGKATLITTKFFHTVVVLTDNRIYTWGCHPLALRQTAHILKRHRHQGGVTPHRQKDLVEGFLVPLPVDTSYVHSRITQVACGSHHNTVLTVDGEIYVWGRNVEGQLGSGSRQDIKHPTMLTSVNDRCFTFLTCGGEFTVAMDTDSLIWVWGKNDGGQLGMGRSDGQAATTTSRMSSKKNPASMMYDVIQPVTLNSLPTVSMATSWQRVVISLSVESTDSDTGLLWANESYDGRDTEMSLPDLEKIGSQPYTCRLLPIVLKHLGERCNLQMLMRECMDCRDWLSAADLHLYQQHYPLALGCHLRYITDHRKHLGNLENFIGSSTKVMDYYMRQLQQYPVPEKQAFIYWRVLLLEVFYFWEENHLPASHLENFLLSHLDNIVRPLAMMLFRSDSVANPSENCSEILGIPSRLRKHFKAKFQLTILSRVLEMVQSGEQTDEMSQVFGELLQDDQGQDQSSRLLLESSDKLIPYDRLWHEVLQNVRKDWDTRNYIYLTARDVEILQAQIQKENGALDTDKSEMKGSGNDAVLFTCGHNFTKHTFGDEVVPNFIKDIGMGPSALPKTASLLSQYYSRPGFIPMACPICVRKAIHSMQ